MASVDDDTTELIPPDVAETSSESAKPGATAVAAPAADDEPATDTDAPRSRARTAAGVTVALVCVGAAIAGSVFLGIGLHDRSQIDATDSLRAAYIDAGRAGITALTTISATSADKDVKTLLARSSGDFKADFGGRSTSYTQVVKEAGVTSTGRIVSVGVERFDDKTATLLIAAHADIKNQGSPQPEARDYRFRVTVTNGAPPTLSKVDFVL